MFTTHVKTEPLSDSSCARAGISCHGLRYRDLIKCTNVGKGKMRQRHDTTAEGLIAVCPALVKK